MKKLQKFTPRKSQLVKNAEKLNGKRDMRKKVVKSTSVGSDLKKRMVKRQQGGTLSASYINVEEPVLQYDNNGWIPVEDVFSDYNLPTQLNKTKEEPLPEAVKYTGTEEAKDESEKKPIKQNAFINGLRPIISDTLKNRGIDTKWTDHLVAQAALESGWGKSESGKFNLSGIKGKGTTRSTKEYINGKMINTKDSFKDYKNYEDWANQYINLLTNKRYGKAFSMSEQEFMPYIVKQGYATDPNYISKYNKVLNEVKKYEVGGKIQRFKDGKPLKNDIKTDNYVAHTNGWGWWNSLMNLGDGKNHITFEQRSDLTPLNVNEEKQYLLDWYQNENTLKRVKNLTGERIPESLREGTFKNINAKAYIDKDDNNSYYMRPWTSAGNYIKLSPNADEVTKIHEINHAYKTLHEDLLYSDQNKYRPWKLGIFKKEVQWEDPKQEEYYNKPTEIHSRLMEIRKRLGKNAGVEIKQEELTPELLEESDADKYNPEVLLYWLNTIAYKEPQTKNTVQYAQTGSRLLIKKRF